MPESHQKPQSDRELLEHIQRSHGQTTYKQLVRDFGLGGGSERRVVLEQLTRLVKQGLLIRNDGKKTWSVPVPTSSRAPERGRAERAERRSSFADKATPATRQRGVPTRSGDRFAGFESAVRSSRERLLSGRLDLHRDGFGFVRVDGGAAATAGDIFIPPNDINGAMQGDQVLVDEAPPGRDGRRSGRIARVLNRRNPTVVGIFHYADAPVRGNRRASRGDVSEEVFAAESRHLSHYVTPIDERVASLVVIADGDEIPAMAAGAVHRTLGDEARVQTPVLRGERPLEGMAVDVEITAFPTPGRPARGRVLEVLGPPDAFGVDVEIMIRKHHIPHVFPPAVLAEATEESARTVASLGADEVAHREDFRGLPVVTIDGETAKDFDDAVYVRALANGNTELQVHIADVSFYVRPGSPLDTEARVRGTSVYFPDRAVPMLPAALSSGMCSLLPEQDRLVLSCVMEVDPRGEIMGYRVAEGLIRSARRMTYTSVQHCLDAVTETAKAEDLAERERVQREQPELPAAVDAMLALALRLNAKRVRRGSIDFDLPEPVIQFDPDGNMKAVVRSERGWAHRLIEEFMLSANECVATWLSAQGIASIYRIHEMPDPKRIVDFEETAAGFGQSLGIGSLPVKKFTMKSDRRTSARNSSRGRDTRAPQQHEVPESIPVTPQMYQKLIRKIAGLPEERILAYLMLRSLKQAKYAEKNEGHFALASPNYTHFTSPIRRYPDLIVHRLLRAMLESGADPQGGAIHSGDVQPWQEELERSEGKRPTARKTERAERDPIAAEELTDIAAESSQAERRSADAERELIEWKKMKFMADKIGDDFHAVILSVTKYGFFVELNDMFIEGLVPIASLVGDFYTFRDTDRTIVGARTGHVFALGQKVEVILDRIDRQQRRLQFALLPGTEPVAASLRAPGKKKRAAEEKRPSATTKRSGKAKTRQRNKKSKGKR